MEAVRARLDSGGGGVLQRIRWSDRRRRARSGVEYQPESTWFRDGDIAGGGVLMDWGPYDMTMLVSLLDPVSATVTDSMVWQHVIGGPSVPATIDDAATAVLRLELRDGSKVRIDYERASVSNAQKDEQLFEFEFDSETVRINWREDQSVTVIADRGGLPVAQTRSLNTLWNPHAVPLATMLDQVGGKECHGSFGTDALFAFRIVRAIYEASEFGERVRVMRDCAEGSLDGPRT